MKSLLRREVIIWSVHQLSGEQGFSFRTELCASPQLYLENIFFSDAPWAVIWDCASLSSPSSGRAPLYYYYFFNLKCGSAMERKGFLSAPCAHSHIKLCKYQAGPAVSAFPWAKLLCRCPPKHGDENRNPLWSKHLLRYFSATVTVRAHMVPVLCVNHPSPTDECIFHIRQAPLAKYVPPAISLRSVGFSFIPVRSRIIGASFMSLLIF